MAHPSTHLIIEDSLQQVADTAGDPTARVYKRLFALRPDFEEMFIMDVDGGVRGNMLTTCLDCIMGIAEGKDTPRFLLEAAELHHDGYGVSAEDIRLMFAVIRDEFREILGARWTAEMERGWAVVLGELAGINVFVR